MDQLEALLVQFLLPDNAARQQAEEAIKKLAKDPAIVPKLLEQVKGAHHAEVRQLAAVLLRKKIAGLWMKLTAEVQENVKMVLLESIAREPHPLVRRASADVVSIIAKYTVPMGTWPGLLQFLFECSQSQQEDHREIALILFSSLTETIGENLRPHFAALHTVFVNGLRDQHSNRVRTAALKAVGALVGYISSQEEVLMFRQLVPPVLDVARFCLAHGDEDTAGKAFEIFDELVESPAPLLGPTIPGILHFALEVASTTKYELSTRNQALQIVTWLAKYKPKTLVKHKLVGAILGALCPMCAEASGGVDDDEYPAKKSAAQVIDTLALHLPKKQVYPPIAAFAKQAIQSPDPLFREAAVTSLGVIAEGCAEVMRKRLKELLPVILAGLQDGDKEVRGQSAFALGLFAESLQPEMAEHYEQVLPPVFDLLKDPDDEVQEKAYYALAAYCEHLGEEILPFLEPLMAHLMEALQSNKRELQEICISAIGSAAAASEQHFLPYAERTLFALKALMQLTSDKDLVVRARATEMVGVIAVAVGKEAMAPVLPGFIEDALKGFALDYSELREYTHGFLGHAATTLGADFAQYLPHVMPFTLASCNLDDGQVLFDESAATPSAKNTLSALSSDSDSDDDSDRRRASLSIRTGVLDEKSAATQALGLYARHAGTAFVPYLEEALKLLKKLAGYFHEDVRLQAVQSLEHLLSATVTAFPIPPSKVLPPQVKHVLDVIVETYLRTFDQDDDKNTVAQACESLAAVVRSIGMPGIEPFVQPISKAVLEFLEQEATCQLVDAPSDSDGDDEEQEHDEVLMDAATDLMPALAAALGPAYAPLFAEHFVPLWKFAKATRPPSDRTMAVATVAEVAREMGPPIALYVDAVLPVAIQELGCEEGPSRRNASYCVGKLCEHAPEQAQQHYPALLSALYPLFSPDEEPGVRDNAAAAVARMILARPGVMPIAQVLPVFLQALPLTEDLDEAGVVYGCLFTLIEHSPNEVAPLIPQIVSVFGQTVVEDSIDEEIKKGVGVALKSLQARYQAHLQPTLAALPPEQASALSNVMGSL